MHKKYFQILEKSYHFKTSQFDPRHTRKVKAVNVSSFIYLPEDRFVGVTWDQSNKRRVFSQTLKHLGPIITADYLSVK